MFIFVWSLIKNIKVFFKIIYIKWKVMLGLLERLRLYKDELFVIKKCKFVFGMIKVFD